MEKTKQPKPQEQDEDYRKNMEDDALEQDNYRRQQQIEEGWGPGSWI